MRLIDAEKLTELCDIMADKCDGSGASIWNQFRTTIEWSPTVDAVLVAHGSWMDGDRLIYGPSHYYYRYCSECLYERDDDNPDKDTPFCPNCGAKMNGGDYHALN